MAINTNTEDSSSSAGSSPRISFSKDLREINTQETQEEVEIIRLDSSLLPDSNSDFNFCIIPNFSENEAYYPPADELFFNGMIIPTQMKQKLNTMSRNPNSQEEDEEITASTTATLIREVKSQSKSSWRFKRSSSLNCENYSSKKSSIWSLPLLFRSKSTGSTIVNNSSYDNSKQNQKKSKFLGQCGSKISCSSHQKPPLKKSGCINNSHGLRNSGHVLNVPSPYIVKGTSDFFGFSTLFRSGSIDKKSKKLTGF